MIAAAITTLKDKNGSSLQAIKRYIAANYRVDIRKLGPHIEKALWTGVIKKTITKTRGGYFKLAKKKKKKKKLGRSSH